MCLEDTLLTSVKYLILLTRQQTHATKKLPMVMEDAVCRGTATAYSAWRQHHYRVANFKIFVSICVYASLIMNVCANIIWYIERERWIDVQYCMYNINIYIYTYQVYIKWHIVNKQSVGCFDSLLPDSCLWGNGYCRGWRTLLLHLSRGLLRFGHEEFHNSATIT